MFALPGTRVLGCATIIAVALALHPTWYLGRHRSVSSMCLFEGRDTCWKIAATGMYVISIKLSTWLLSTGCSCGSSPHQ